MIRTGSIPSRELQPTIPSGARSVMGWEPLKSADRLPKISGGLLTWFTWYSRRHLRRHFHSLRLSKAGMPPGACGLPLVVYSNHASWWDPLVCLVLKEAFYPGRHAYAPMDSVMLQRYGLFRRLGFFGVERDHRRGAARFLRTAEAVLRSPRSLLAITPQGRFADVRERPVRFESGLGHLAARVPCGLFVPFAAEYVLWAERLPEILVRFGEPVEIQSRQPGSPGAKYYTALFEQRLTETQDALAADSQRREPADFQIVMHGGTGSGGVHDLWKAFRLKLTGATQGEETRCK